MSNKIIERVAKAINPDIMNMVCYIPNCRECEDDKNRIREMAKAAIAAMREPTDVMLNNSGTVFGGEIWRDMIDAALKED